MENSGVSTMGKERLIEQQEKDTTLLYIQEQVVSETEAGCNQVAYYKRSGVLRRHGDHWMLKVGRCESCTPDSCP